MMISELYRRDKLLTITGVFNLVLGAVLLVAALFEGRTVMGINVWFKPIKFCVSIGAYVLTLAWFIGHLKKRGFLINMISFGVSLGMLVEIALITFQAARGTMSHFNLSTALDISIFSTMGAMIGIDMILTIILLVILLFAETNVSGTYLWGVRLGLATFIGFASFTGVALLANNGHTIGAPDGGAGLPFANWSTMAGDLRIPHLLGIHALQIIPLVGFFMAQRWSDRPAASRNLALVGFTLVYGAVYFWTYQQASGGIPLLRM